MTARLIIITWAGKQGPLKEFDESPVFEDELQIESRDNLFCQMRQASRLVRVVTVEQNHPLVLVHAAFEGENALVGNKDVVAVMLLADVVLPIE